MILGGKKRAQGTRHGGFVVSDLSSVGAGSSEGWIQDPSLLIAMSAHLLAFAKGAHCLIVGWEGPSPDDEGSAPAPVHLRLPFAAVSKASQEQPLPLRITAAQWVLFQDSSFLALGTSEGSVFFYSSRGSLLHKQLFQGTPVLQLHVRGSQRKSSQHSSVEELCVMYAKAIVRVDALDLQPLLHRCLKNAQDRAQKGLSDDLVNDMDSTVRTMPHQVWNVSRNLGGSSKCVDGVIAGVMPPPLLEHQSTQRYFCAITVGPDCTLAAHRLSEDRSSSLRNIIMRRVLPATVSTVTALAKMIWRNPDKHQETSDYRPPEVKPQEFGRASLITSLQDRPRKGERIALSPSGAMAAVTDSLGRILLVDTQALVAIRIWKGYRDAQCCFLEVPVDGATASSGPKAYRGPSKHDMVLCLAIHAPRREVVEVWKLRDGPRLSIVKCEKGCRLIQPVCRLRGAEHDVDGEYVPAEAYVLNGDSGHLSVLSPQIPAS